MKNILACLFATCMVFATVGCDGVQKGCDVGCCENCVCPEGECNCCEDGVCVKGCDCDCDKCCDENGCPLVN